MRRSLMLLLLCWATTFAGCYRVKLNIHDNYNASRSRLYDETWHHNGFLGLAEFSDPVDLDKACEPGRIESIEQKTSFVEGLIHIVSDGLYTPQEVTIYCGPQVANNTQK